MFAYVSGPGYVGIGRITGTVIPARDAQVEIEGRPQPLLDLRDVSAAWKQKTASDDSQVTEMVVPAQWRAAQSIERPPSRRSRPLNATNGVCAQG